jgi:hypothetical protein
MVKARTRIAMLALATGAAVLLVGCGGSDGGGSRSDAATDRQAGYITRGTAVCIRNASSDTLRISITQAQDDEPAFANTNGTEDLAPNRSRCMKSDAYTASGTARARVTIASGEVFTVEGFNPPANTPWIGINGDARELANIGATTDFKIGKHPIRALRDGNTPDYVRFGVTIGNG